MADREFKVVCLPLKPGVLINKMYIGPFLRSSATFSVREWMNDYSFKECAENNDDIETF